jgi:hypothetical protein
MVLPVPVDVLRPLVDVPVDPVPVVVPVVRPVLLVPPVVPPPVCWAGSEALNETMASEANRNRRFGQRMSMIRESIGSRETGEATQFATLLF